MMPKKLFFLSVFCCIAMLLAACISPGQSAPDTSGIVSGKICYPSDDLPALTLYFESTTDDRLITYQTHEDQSSYAVELEEGIYKAYAWLLEEIPRGGMYSEAVPCGLKVDCTDHSLIPVIVKPGKETSGVDICDWYAPLGEEPLPPGKIEGMIADFLQEEHPDLTADFWTVYEDDEYGVRFAVPCFWEVDFPDQYHPSGTAYPIRNYTEAFAMSFGKKQGAVWENGGIKIDMIFLSGENWGLPDDATLEDFLTVSDTDPDPSVEEILINEQKGLLVTSKTQLGGGVHSFHLFKVSENLFLSFDVYPPQANRNPDVQGILHSLALSPEIEVAIPEIVPGDSPQEGELACLQPSE